MLWSRHLLPWAPPRGLLPPGGSRCLMQRCQVSVRSSCLSLPRDHCPAGRNCSQILTAGFLLSSSVLSVLLNLKVILATVLAHPLGLSLLSARPPPAPICSRTQLSTAEQVFRAQATALSLWGLMRSSWKLSLTCKGRIVMDAHETACAIRKSLFSVLTISGLRFLSRSVS